MYSFFPAQQKIAEAIRQAQSDIASGDVIVEGAGPFWRFGLVRAVCERLGDVNQEMIHRVYVVLRLLEQGEGKP